MPYRNKNDAPANPTEKKRPPLLLLFWLAVSITVIFTIYQVFVVRFQVGWLFWAYYAATFALALIYIVYNFGLSRRHVTPDMLPDTWTVDQKYDYIAEGEERKKKSRFILVLLIGFLFTFCYDMLTLFLPDTMGAFQGMVDAWFS